MDAIVTIKAKATVLFSQDLEILVDNNKWKIGLKIIAYSNN
jgi:hypothetical protein